jgi:serpin B
VVVDAIYFKGLWATPFAKTQTSTQPFHLAGGGQDLVPLMHHVDRVAYFETNEFQAVELPYHDKRMAMVVILPREPEGCFRLEKRLTPALLSSALGQMKSQKVELFLPRFKLESRFDLNTTLSGMGMTDAFGRQADFSGIDGSRQLYISGIYHKAWGEVNEQGTEAAAATGVGFAAMAVQKPPAAPPIFRADHPFIFFIRDSRSGSLIFMGRLMNPKDS